MIIFAKKSLGQNFLSNPRILEKIADAAELTKNDVVLEIGPGAGNLTKILAERAGRVIAVEKDRRLIENLKKEMPENVEIIEVDILKFNPTSYKLQATSYKVVGNIPYYITSHLLRNIFEKWLKPELVVLTVQKEVAQRIVAKPPNMSILAISVQFYADVKIIGYISKRSFHPAPKVDSAIIKLNPKSIRQDFDGEPLGDEPRDESLSRTAQDPESIEGQIEKFFDIVRLGFSSKRKKLLSNLSRKFDKQLLEKTFTEIGLGPNIRAEELSLENWQELAKKLL